jgi:hypothetical protein
MGSGQFVVWPRKSLTLTSTTNREDGSVKSGYVICICILTPFSFGAAALAQRGLDPFDACGALGASVEKTTIDVDVLKKLSGGYGLARVVARCNEDKESCQKLQQNLRSRKIPIPNGLTCSK